MKMERLKNGLKQVETPAKKAEDYDLQLKLKLTSKLNAYTYTVHTPGISYVKRERKKKSRLQLGFM